MVSEQSTSGIISWNICVKENILVHLIAIRTTWIWWTGSRCIHLRFVLKLDYPLSQRLEGQESFCARDECGRTKGKLSAFGFRCKGSQRRSAASVRRWGIRCRNMRAISRLFDSPERSTLRGNKSIVQLARAHFNFSLKDQNAVTKIGCTGVEAWGASCNSIFKPDIFHKGNQCLDRNLWSRACLDGRLFLPLHRSLRRVSLISLFLVSTPPRPLSLFKDITLLYNFGNEQIEYLDQ